MWLSLKTRSISNWPSTTRATGVIVWCGTSPVAAIISASKSVYLYDFKIFEANSTILLFIRTTQSKKLDIGHFTSPARTFEPENTKVVYISLLSIGKTIFLNLIMVMT